MPVLALAFAAAFLQQPAPPAPPQDLTLPPETAEIVAILEGRGTQIYACTATAGRGPSYRWVLQAPKAQLFNLATGKAVGHHDAGPTWTLDDGSAISGTPLHNQPATSPTDVPWLLIRTTPSATATPGILTPVAYVRRYNTHGGAAPAPACAAMQQGKTVEVPYSASYAFYTDPGAPSLQQGFGQQLPNSPVGPRPSAPPPPPVPPPAPPSPTTR